MKKGRKKKSFVRRYCRTLIVLAVVFLFFLFGLDEPVANSTFNRPDHSCEQTSDCAFRYSGDGNYCVNNEWFYYPALVKSVFAVDEMYDPLYSCSCNSGICEQKTNIYLSEDLKDCEFFVGNQLLKCYEIVMENVIKKSCESISIESEREECYSLAGKRAEEFIEEELYN